MSNDSGPYGIKPTPRGCMWINGEYTSRQTGQDYCGKPLEVVDGRTAKWCAYHLRRAKAARAVPR